jgi:DNA processing protein
MIRNFNFKIPELKAMKKYPKELFYIGNINLLKKRKVSIVGSRHPNQYSKQIIQQISNKLSARNICIVSGGAIGIDTIAHKAAGLSNTIMVAGTGLDKKYPSINKKMIEEIENTGLVISQFQANTPSNKYNFPLRNELVVSLGDILIVAYADINSGTMRSIEYAIKMKKQIYVLPHRIDESLGTNTLLKQKQVEAIYNIDEFVDSYTKTNANFKEEDEFLLYCMNNPNYENAIKKYGSKVFEYELEGKVKILNGNIII